MAWRRLVDLLETLAEMDEKNERTRSGRHVGDRSTVDYSVTVGSADGGAGDDPPEVEGADETDVDWHADVRETGGGVLVVADLPGVAREDVGVAVDDGALLVVHDGRLLGRTALPARNLTVASATYRNSVLEVHLAPEEEES